ncbi:tetratricopeptide repeat protein [Sessilibacter sp. MAH4]
MWSYFLEIYQLFSEKSSIDQFGIILSVLGVVIGPLTALIIWIGKKLLRSKTAKLSEELEHYQKLLATEQERSRELKKSLQKTQTELEHTRNQLPATWLKQVNSERQDGNEGRAYKLLLNGFNGICEDFAKVTNELAGWYDLSREYQQKTGLQEATRFAELTNRLQPNNKDYLSYLAELLELKAAINWQHQGEELTRDQEGIIDQLFSETPDPERLSSRFCTLCTQNVITGHHFTAYRFAIRAEQVAQRLAFDHPQLLTAQYNKSQSLLFLGLYQEALDVVDTMLPVKQRVKGEEHPDTLATLHLRALVLSQLGKNGDALNAIDTLLPIQQRVNGKEHPNTLMTRFLRADVLGNLGNDNDALDAIDTLLPIQQRVLGKEHPDTLNTQHLRALILSNLGRNDDALDAIHTLLPIRQQVLGKDHPNTLVTFLLRAKILFELGHTEEAMDAINTLLPKFQQAFGEEHPELLKTLYIKSKFLNHLSKIKAAQELASEVLKQQTYILGKEHPNTKETQELLEEIQSGEG